MTKEELLKNYFAKDGYVKLSGIEIAEITEEKAVVCAKVNPDHLNGNGFVQGGMLYTLADFAFAVLSNYLHPMTVTQCGQITYLRPAKTDFLTATARETARAGHNTVSEVLVQDASGAVVCICHFNGFVKDVTWEDFDKIVNQE
ncbi:MAG: PaaI family thioesterase [Clostridia bacterium]|nr:PaaI family thioesterase [Clostridia bacterium]